MLVDFRVFGLRDVVDSWEDVLDFVFYGFRVKCVFYSWNFIQNYSWIFLTNLLKCEKIQLCEYNSYKKKLKLLKK